MNRIILGSLLSCMLLGQIIVADDTFVTSAVMPSLVGAGSGALYTLAKAYYAHRTYAVETNIFRYGTETCDLAKTLAFGAELGEFNPGVLFSPEPYINTLAFNTTIGAGLTGSIGVLYGFYKNNFGEGCKIAAGNIITFAAVFALGGVIHNEFSRRNRYENGHYSATRFGIVRPENQQNQDDL